jgi:hypothetical protein
MQLNRLLAFACAAAAMAALFSSAIAQQPGTVRPGTMPQPQHRMGSFLKPRVGVGQIIGNKNTKVYHLPGDKGSLPAEKNRVYFRTERDAMAAGYHRAKVGGKMKTVKPMTHGMGTMGHGLPK